MPFGEAVDEQANADDAYDRGDASDVCRNIVAMASGPYL
jgi:hypothetical protein